LAKRARAFKSEKRKKELKRQEKQAKKRLRREGKDISSEAGPVEGQEPAEGQQEEAVAADKEDA